MACLWHRPSCALWAVLLLLSSPLLPSFLSAVKFVSLLCCFLLLLLLSWLQERHAGDLGNLETDSKGHATYAASNDKLKVWDLIGRAVVVYQGEDDGGKGGDEGSRLNGNAGAGIAAAVIARSAGVGENYKSLCTCDGTVIWEATDSDYVTQKPEPATAL